MKKRIGIVQCNISPDKNANLSNTLKLASKDLADFVVLPELFTTGYNLNKELAEGDAGNTVKALSSFAKQRNTNVIGGSIIEREGDKFYNTCYIFDRSGQTIGKYSKRNLFRPFSEHKFFSPAQSNTSNFILDDISIGVMICYDLRFSDMALNMKRNSPKIIFCPMEWPSTRTETRECFAKARAAECYSYLIAANAAYTIDRSLEMLACGASSISSPSGSTLFKAGLEEGFYTFDIDLEACDETRAFFEKDT